MGWLSPRDRVRWPRAGRPRSPSRSCALLSSAAGRGPGRGRRVAVPVVPGRMGRGERAFRPFGEVHPPQALVLFTHRGERVLDAGAQDFVETVGLAAPLALIGAVAQAQAGVVKVVRAAVLAFGEQAGAALVAAVAQQEGLRRARRSGVQAEEPEAALTRPAGGVTGLAGDRHGLLLTHGARP